MATAPTDRTRVRRVPPRGAYERETIEAILDETLISHVGFVHDGQPVVIPTLHARLGDRLYLHGSAASRMLRTLQKGVPVCVTATLVDGLVLARSAFHHSVNYRSVVVFGTATPRGARGGDGKVLELFTEKLVPGRWADVRPPNAPGAQGHQGPQPAARRGLRQGPHGPADRRRRGLRPARLGGRPAPRTEVAEPQPDPRLDPAIETPGYVAAWRP